MCPLVKGGRYYSVYGIVWFHQQEPTGKLSFLDKRDPLPDVSFCIDPENLVTYEQYLLLYFGHKLAHYHYAPFPPGTNTHHGFSPSEDDD